MCSILKRRTRAQGAIASLGIASFRFGFLFTGIQSNTHTINNAEGMRETGYTMANALSCQGRGDRGGYIYCIVGYKAHDSPIEHVGAHVMRVVENANHGDGKQRQYAASHIDAETATCN